MGLNINNIKPEEEKARLMEALRRKAEEERQRREERERRIREEERQRREMEKAYNLAKESRWKF